MIKSVSHRVKHCGVKVEPETEKADSMKYKTFIPLMHTFKAFTPLKGDTKWSPDSSISPGSIENTV